MRFKLYLPVKEICIFLDSPATLTFREPVSCFHDGPIGKLTLGGKLQIRKRSTNWELWCAWMIFRSVKGAQISLSKIIIECFRKLIQIQRIFILTLFFLRIKHTIWRGSHVSNTFIWKISFRLYIYIWIFTSLICWHGVKYLIRCSTVDKYCVCRSDISVRGIFFAAN